ncbi:MAG: glycerate kinase [Kiritimatiellae bacterium]|nr:glycerate kinase [Kiritimatiellia bacterium]
MKENTLSPIRRCVVAFDSWKGTMSADEACAVFSRAAAEAKPGLRFESCPMADGGEGTAAVLQSALGGEWRRERVRGPMPGQHVEARWLWQSDARRAVVEMAQAAGLTLAPEGGRDPGRATTYGVGELIRAAAGAGARELVITLGGSATVDGGAGMAQALGFRLRDARGGDLSPGGAALADLDRIERPDDDPLRGIRILAWSDVTHPLLGVAGAAPVFGPQKGASPDQVRTLERGLERLAFCLGRDLGRDVGAVPGGGAAGGLGAGIAGFLGGTLESGIAGVLRATRLAERVNGAEWVVTGEGRFDATSLRGKVVGGVLEVARAAGARVAIVAGECRVAEPDWRSAGGCAVYATRPPDLPLEEALRHAPELLAAAAHRFAREAGGTAGPPAC